MQLNLKSFSLCLSLVLFQSFAIAAIKSKQTNTTKAHFTTSVRCEYLLTQSLSKNTLSRFDKVLKKTSIFVDPELLQNIQQSNFDATPPLGVLLFFNKFEQLKGSLKGVFIQSSTYTEKEFSDVVSHIEENFNILNIISTPARGHLGGLLLVVASPLDVIQLILSEHTDNLKEVRINRSHTI